MPAAVPTTEPDLITAGETLAWTRSLPDYPATAYTLKYALQSRGLANIVITATAAGDDYAISVADTVTADYAPGVYTVTAYVEALAGSPRYIIGRGSITILPSPLSALGTTHASRTLALIESAIEGRIPNGLETTSIDGQQISRIPVQDLARLQRIYQAKVALEDAAARAAAGLRIKRTIGIRFVRP